MNASEIKVARCYITRENERGVKVMHKNDEGWFVKDIQTNQKTFIRSADEFLSEIDSECATPRMQQASGKSDGIADFLGVLFLVPIAGVAALFQLANLAQFFILPLAFLYLGIRCFIEGHPVPGLLVLGLAYLSGIPLWCELQNRANQDKGNKGDSKPTLP